MDIFLTGGTGFVGNAVAAALLEEGHVVRALVREGSSSKLKVAGRCEIIAGDLDDLESIGRGMAGADAVIHLVGIIEERPRKDVTFEKVHVEGTENVARACLEAGVRRFVHMSALGARADASSRYFRTKWAAEEFLRGLDIDVTVFRPSVIMGPGGEFTGLLKQLCSLPVTPVIGDGKYRLQPVAIGNVAECFIRALGRPETVGKAYCVGGPEALSFNEMLDIYGAAMGRKVRLLHLPKSPIAAMTGLFEGLPGWPITVEQLSMLGEDNLCETSAVREDLGLNLTAYRDACEESLK